MKLKKIFNVIKDSKKVDIMNVPGAVIFAGGPYVFSVKDMPALLSAEEFGAIFEIEADKLCDWEIHIDSETERERAFLSVGRGVPLEKAGSISFAGIRCVLFKKAEERQLSFDEDNAEADTGLRGYIAIDPDMLSPVCDGIVSFEYIRFLGAGCVLAYENSSPVAVIRPREIESESLELMRDICEGLGAYYARE